MKKNIIIFGMFTWLVLIYSFTFTSHIEEISRKDSIITDQIQKIEKLKINIFDKNRIIYTLETDLKDSIENIEMLASLSPLKGLIDDNEIIEIMDEIPHGNPFRTDFHITAGFGESLGYYGPRLIHEGTDLIPINPEDMKWTITPIAPGEVVSFGYDRIHGKNITIQHSPKVRSRYSHLSMIYNTGTTGNFVNSNSAIGRMGSTGLSTGSHVHLEIQIWTGYEWKKINPAPFLTRDVQ